MGTDETEDLLHGARVGGYLQVRHQASDGSVAAVGGGGDRVDLGPVLAEGGHRVHQAVGIIPCNPHLDNLKTPAETTILKVFPGDNGTGTLYEDDGDSESYQDGAFATTTFAHRQLADRTCLYINARTGTYAGMADRRSWQVQFLLAPQPREVLVNGTPAGNYTYDEESHTLTVDIRDVSADVQTVVAYTHDLTGIRQPAADGQASLPWQASPLSSACDLQGRKVPTAPAPVNRQPVIINRKKVLWKE